MTYHPTSANRISPLGPDQLRIGVDIGGSKIRAGLFAGVNLIKDCSVVTPATLSSDDVLLQVFRQIDALYTDEIVSIGVGSPSLVDSRNGTVYEVANIPSWFEFPLGGYLKQRYKGSLVSVNNDSNCFAIGEYLRSLDSSPSTLIGMTIGTGIGAGIIINGLLHEGIDCSAGELGAIPYKTATIEAYASGSAFRRMYGKNGEDLAYLADSGDASALHAMHLHGIEIGHAVTVAALAYGPNAVVIGGSVSHSFMHWQSGMHSVLQTALPRRLYQQLSIYAGETRRSSLLGAAFLPEFLSSDVQ